MDEPEDLSAAAAPGDEQPPRTSPEHAEGPAGVAPSWHGQRERIVSALGGDEYAGVLTQPGEHLVVLVPRAQDPGRVLARARAASSRPAPVRPAPGTAPRRRGGGRCYWQASQSGPASMAQALTPERKSSSSSTAGAVVVGSATGISSGLGPVRARRWCGWTG
ncbi:hypothetical protein NUM3379_15980 [Kineococcus sp. NUM-3379]